MNNKLIIIGITGILGIGAVYFFVIRKKNTNVPNSKLGEAVTPSVSTNTGGQSTDPTLNTPLKETPKLLSVQEMQTITSLRDTILNDIKRIGTYKRSATRNAVKIDIDSNIENLKNLGYALDKGNNLVKIEK